MPDNEIAAAVKDIHRLYCQLTGQHLTLRYDRERLWFEFLRSGFTSQELRHVVRYLQKEIRAGRRNYRDKLSVNTVTRNTKLPSNK